jgi:two-component system sensor histidine kinase/response regulator
LAVGLAATALAAGVLVTWWLVSRADGAMRAEQLQKAMTVAKALNVAQVKALSSTAADLDKPEYQRITEQIKAVCSVNSGWRWIYLMGRKSDGAVFFYLDTEPLTSKDHAPPGQVYEEAPKSFQQVFDSGKPATEGPYTDRWGTWVSALIPVIDEQAGAVVAVLGVDVDASAWKGEIAARVALPVGMMLIAAIGILSAFAAARRGDASPRPVLHLLMLPLAAIVFLLLAGAGVTLLQQYQEKQKTHVADNTSGVAGDLIVALEQQAFGLALAAQPIAADPGVQEALREGAADRLLTVWAPVFENLRRSSHLTHFYFFDAHRVCLLRVHKPEKRGDIINRFTALEAERTGKAASGLDLGPLGTFTLRVVQPVFGNGALVGYVELGKEIEDVLEEMRVRSGNQLAVVIGKEFLNRQVWEEGMRLLGRSAEWDRLPSNAVIYASQGFLPDAFLSWANEMSGGHADGAKEQEIAFDGKVFVASSTPLQDASGQEVGDLLIMHDVTADKAAFARLLFLAGSAAVVLLALLLCVVYVMLRRADRSILTQQKSLQESAETFRAIMNSAHDAILMIDNNGNVSYWNPAAESTLGYTHKEAFGRNLHALIVPERFLPAHHAAFPPFQKTGQGNAIGKTLELAARRKDGREIYVALSLSAVSIEGKWHAVGILHDITASKQAEADILATNVRLENAVARANEMAVRAEAANVAKSEFLANMSHEIRTPMNGVIGMTGLLLDTELNDEQRRYAETVRASGEALLALINDILDISKMEANKLSLELLPFELMTLLDDFAVTLGVPAQEKGLELICAVDPAVPLMLCGDPGRLRQILTNLTGNAIKFTKSGEVAVRVSLVESHDDDVQLRFAVSDTGIGIPADKIGLLFEKFSQADASTTRQYGGTGLGLAISKQLAELMGGEIGVKSVDGKGSEFWFTVRLSRQAAGAQVESGQPADLRGVRVLIVDDNATSREILTTRLSGWGMRPSTADNGPAAIQALSRAMDENDRFRVAVLDMQMPGMDGETLGRVIKADRRLAEVPLVMLTSIGARGDARHFEEIGFAAYTTKPVRHNELKGILSKVLAGSAPASTPAVRKPAGEPRDRFAGRNARILVVEDNITNQQVSLGILKKLGLRADAVANGEEAVTAIHTLSYDLILMDVQMPVMDGFEATRRIREREKVRSRAGVPIIAMTAHALQGDRERCLESGMNDYISKPVLPNALIEVLEKWLPMKREAGGQMAEIGPDQKGEVGGRGPEVFDRAGMMARLMNDEALARTVVGGFLEDLPCQIEALRCYVKAGDVAGVERQCHTIRGASSNVGGEALCEVAFELEKFGRAGDVEAVRQRLPDLENQFRRLEEAMVKHSSRG